MALALRIRILGALVAGGACVLGGLTIAQGFDPEAPAIVVVGTPRGYAPSERLGSERRGRSHGPLPRAPRRLWSRELPGGLTLPPVVDQKGGVIAALSSPDVVRLAGEDGKQSWRTRLGARAAVAGPVLASDGSVAVVGDDGMLWSVSAAGGVRFATPLEMRTHDVAVTPVALDDGGVIVAGEDGLVHVDARGQIVARAVLTLGEMRVRPSGALLGYQRGVLATGQDGEVVYWRAPAPPRLLGSFGGELDGGAMLVGSRMLVAVVDRMRLVALDLKTGAPTLLSDAGDAALQLEGPPTLSSRGLLLLTNVGGELIRIDAHGVAVGRIALEPAPALFGVDAGAITPFFQRFKARSSPPLVADAAGRVAFLRSSGKLGIVDPGGSVVTANPRVCTGPLVVLPAGPRRMLVACGSGAVSVFGDT